MSDDHVILTDVTGRDGFQMEKEWIQTTDKTSILNGILDAGVKRMEATSFVSPKAVPQMQDAKEVVQLLNKKDVDVISLIPNLKGGELALDAGVDEVNVVVSVSEIHNKKNVNLTVDESIKNIEQIYKLMTENGKKVRVGLGTTFGCPFQGIYTVKRVAAVIEKLKAIGLRHFLLADTTGMANPVQITSFVQDLTKKFPDVHFSLHLHNTRGMGLANVYAGYQAGIRHFDAALGGIGGCPFAPGATGNVCLEDVVHMFEQMNVSTDIDIRKLIESANRMEEILGYKLPGQVMNAGLSTDTFKA